MCIIIEYLGTMRELKSNVAVGGLTGLHCLAEGSHVIGLEKWWYPRGRSYASFLVNNFTSFCRICDNEHDQLAPSGLYLKLKYSITKFPDTSGCCENYFKNEDGNCQGEPTYHASCSREETCK